MNVNWEYVAGFFDGEGNIQIKLPKGKSTSKGIVVKFGQKRREPLIAIKDFLSSQGIQRMGLYDYRDRGKRTNYFVLAISNKRDAKLFIENIKHFSFRGEEIDQALSFIETLSKRHDRPFKQDEIQKIRELYISGIPIEEIASSLKCGCSKVQKFVRREFNVSKILSSFPVSRRCPICGGVVERHGSRVCRECFLHRRYLKKPEVFERPLEARA